jgi:hypothetical protein
MKHCPSCGTQYTDDTLRFCLQDGSQLIEKREAETPTVVLEETPTVVRQRLPAEVTRNDVRSIGRTPGAKKRSSFYPFLIAGITGVALFIAGVAATWIYLSKRPVAGDNNLPNAPNVTGSPSPSNVSGFFPTPSPRNSITPETVPSRNSTPPSTTGDTETANSREDVSNTVDRWKSNAEAVDLDSYMQNYAETVDYYNRRAASRSVVRADKARAFAMYDSIRIDLSNRNISVDNGGQRATAEFDKEWDFRGRRNSSGKVRTQLRLRREGSRWLIVGERDLRVYYVN